jgi:hypothetical protein
MSDYDCTPDVLAHRELVSRHMLDFADALKARAEIHDESKLHDPEKAVFDEFRPKLNYLVHGSPEYEAALVEMGEGLAHHYRSNRHHPQHFNEGVSGMTLQDLVEMFCDWLAAAEEKGVAVDLEYNARRFEIAPQLVRILENSLYEHTGNDAGLEQVSQQAHSTAARTRNRRLCA